MDTSPVEFEFNVGEVIRKDTRALVLYCDCRLAVGAKGLTPAQLQEAVDLWVKESEPKLPEGWDNCGSMYGNSYAQLPQGRAFVADLATIDMFKRIIQWAEWHMDFDGRIGRR